MNIQLDMQLINKNAPEGATLFTPAPKWAGSAFFFKIKNNKVLMLNIHRQWVNAELDPEEIYIEGLLPLTYQPINWVVQLEKSAD